MPIPPETRIPRAEARRNAALWAGLLTGPLVWLLVLEASYMLVASDCHKARRGVLLALVMLGLLLTTGAAGLSWRVWTRVREPGPPEERGPRRRMRFMALGGLGLSALFVLLLLGTTLPTFLLRACD